MLSQSTKDYDSRIVSKSIKALSDVHHFPHFYSFFYVLVNIFLVLKIAQMLLATGWTLKAYSRSDRFFFILKVANIRCFILIAVEIFHNIISI